MSPEREKELREWACEPMASEWRELFAALDLARRERDAAIQGLALKGCVRCEELKRQRDEARSDLRTFQRSSRDALDAWTSTMRCAPTVPETPCYDCLACLRTRLMNALRKP